MPIPTKYQSEFQKIQDSNEAYKGKWNWYAFLLSGVWALHKGCWVLFILFVLTNSLIQFKFVQVSEQISIDFGLTGLLWALLMGWRGTWFYYKRKIKGRQPPF